MDRNYAHFWDMYQACLRIDEFTRNLAWEDYRENQLVQSAVERQFEILGEDVFLLIIKMLTQRFRGKI